MMPLTQSNHLLLERNKNKQYLSAEDKYEKAKDSEAESLTRQNRYLIQTALSVKGLSIRNKSSTREPLLPQSSNVSVLSGFKNGFTGVIGDHTSNNSRSANM